MKRRLLYLLLVLPFVSLSQVHVDIGKILSMHNVSTIRTRLDKIKNTDRVSAYWGREHEIVKGFTETFFTLQESYATDNSNVFTVRPFKICFIFSGNALVYYHYSEEKNKKVNGEWVPYLDKISEYKNDSLYKLLETTFRHTYNALMKKEELFIDDITYGDHCGFAGSSPYWRVVMDSLVTVSDRKGLMKLLQSTITEKQLYGVEGFYQLKKNGVTLTAVELQVIKNVLAKTGEVRTCWGCIVGNENIKELTKGFKF